MEHAKYAVWYRKGAIAWFITEDDAWDFVKSQPRFDQYEVTPI